MENATWRLRPVRGTHLVVGNDWPSCNKGIYIYIIMYIYLFICFIVPLCLDSHIWSISLVYPVYPLGLDSPMTSDRWLVGGWPSPLKNIWVRQLGLLFPTEWKVIKFMFQTTNQTIDGQHEAKNPWVTFGTFGTYSGIHGIPVYPIFVRSLIITGHFRNLNWRYLPYIRPM